MFVRKKRNSSGSVSVQIIKKVKGKSKVVKSVGCSKDEKEINELVEIAKAEINRLEPSLFDYGEKIKFLSISNDEIIPIGDELFIGKLYDRLGLKNIFEDVKSIRYKKEKEGMFF